MGARRVITSYSIHYTKLYDGELLLRALHAEGVRFVWAIPDGTYMIFLEALVLEDLTPAEIEPEAALFVEWLGLDSIDALELAIV